MKKISITLASCRASPRLGALPAAHAQSSVDPSSVTVYGLMDAGLVQEARHQQAHQWRIGSAETAWNFSIAAAAPKYSETIRFDREGWQAMARIFAREAALNTAAEGLALVLGAADSAGNLADAVNMEAIQTEQKGMIADMDLVDQPPLTRRERAEQVKKRNYFAKYGEQARKVLETLLDKFADTDIENIEDIKILTLDPFKNMGTASELVSSFGGKKNYLAAIQELEMQIYGS